MLHVLCFPLIRYALKKLENLFEILENNLNNLEVQTNNNVKEQIQEYKTLSEDGLICIRRENYTILKWILIFPFVICLYACHFLVNVSLLTISKPPIEFEVIRWYTKVSLRYSRIKLMELRIIWLKNRKRKSKILFTQPAIKNSKNSIRILPLFLRVPSNFFINKCRKFINFLKVLLVISQIDSKLDGDETFVFKKEHQVSPTAETPTPIITRRVSVTVQEIIFEETEDSFEGT